MPRPRLHLIRFHGVLAPHAKLRAAIVPIPAQTTTAHAADCDHAHGARAGMSWARLLSVYMNDTPAAEIARAQKPYFPDIDESVLADCIATYQRLGCWTRHVEITHAAYERTLDVYEYNGLLKQRYRYEQVCAATPATD